MPPRKPVKMNLGAFHKGHSNEGEGDLPLGPSGAPDDHRGPRWEEDRPPRDRYPRDDDGPSRADGDGEWRQSGGRRGGGFRSGGGGGGGGGDGPDRGGDRGRGDGFRSGGFDRDRGSGGGFGGGFDRDRGGGGGDRFSDRGDRGGFGGDRPRSGFGGGFDRDRGSGGGFDRDRGSGGGFDRDRGSGGGFDRDRGSGGGGFDRDRGSGGGGFDRDRGSDRGGDDRWRRGGEGGGSRDEGWRESGGDRREGGFRRGESGDVRASGDVRSSGYKPLQLKKKGEASEGPSEPARRSDMFGGSSRDSRDREPLSSRDTRGDARGDAVVIHKSSRAERESRERESREDSDKESNKPSKSPREKEEPPPKQEVEKSALERAIEEKQTVTVDDLTEGLENLKLTADNRSQFSEVIAKSLFLNKITLKEAVETLEEKLPSDAPAAVIGVLQFLKTKKGDDAVLAMVAHSKLNILNVIAKGQSPDALEKLLTDNNLLCLKPVSDLDQHVTKSLNEGKLSPDAILEYINKNTEAKQSTSSLGGAVGARIGQLIFQDPANPDLEVITTYSKLLRRVTSQPKNDARAMAAVLYALQKAWSDAKMPKGALKSVFEKLSQTKLITWEGFDSWREDRENKTPNKPKALMQVNSFLDSIKPKEVEEEDEGDEGDEEEDEE